MSTPEASALAVPEWVRGLNAAAERMAEAGKQMEEAARLMRQDWNLDERM